MSFSSMIEGTIIRAALDKIVASEPRTSFLGLLGGGVIAAKIDYGKLIQGDPQQIGNLVGVVVVVLIGWFTNHSRFKSSPNLDVPLGANQHGVVGMKQIP